MWSAVAQDWLGLSCNASKVRIASISNPSSRAWRMKMSLDTSDSA